MNQVIILMTVAANEGISIQDLVRETGRVHSNVCRNLQTLGLKTVQPTEAQRKRAQQQGKELVSTTRGYGLIETRPDPIHGRQKLCYLTPKGRDCVEDISKDLQNLAQRIPQIS